MEKYNRKLCPRLWSFEPLLAHCKCQHVSVRCVRDSPWWWSSYRSLHFYLTDPIAFVLTLPLIMTRNDSSQSFFLPPESSGTLSFAQLGPPATRTFPWVPLHPWELQLRRLGPCGLTLKTPSTAICGRSTTSCLRPRKRLIGWREWNSLNIRHGNKLRLFDSMFSLVKSDDDNYCINLPSFYNAFIGPSLYLVERSIARARLLCLEGLYPGFSPAFTLLANMDY